VPVRERGCFRANCFHFQIALCSTKGGGSLKAGNAADADVGSAAASRRIAAANFVNITVSVMNRKSRKLTTLFTVASSYIARNVQTSVRFNLKFVSCVLTMFLSDFRIIILLEF